jgi:hypothetical protein
VNKESDSPDIDDDKISIEDARDGSLSSAGADVIAAGLLTVDFGEAGSVKDASAGFVGTAIASALDSAIGGSQEPCQSKAQLSQAGSILLTWGGSTSWG